MKNILLLLFGVALCTACGNQEGTTSKTSTESDAISQCLAAKDYKYEDLLTKADIAKYVDIDEASYKQEISSTKGKYGSSFYKWESDRPEKQITSKVTGAIFKRPDMNQVTIKMLDFYKDDDLKRYKQDSALDLFDQSYKKLGKAEYDELLANMKNKLTNNSDRFEQAKTMMDKRMKFTYEPVENLGDRAYWKWRDDFGIELVVLTGTARFTILSKTTGEPETSLDHAVQFAREVLVKCEG